MSKMLKSSGAMGVATLLSRVLGMARESLYSRFMGDGVEAAAFKLAFLIPNLFRRLLGEGALTAAFIPIFKEKETLEGEEEMWKAANAVISGLIVAAGALSGLVILVISIALALDSPSTLGFDLTHIRTTVELVNPSFPSPGWLSVQARLMLQLLRIMFPYVLLVCFAAIMIGMLNARGHFFVPAMGSTVLNLTLIVTVVLVAPRVGKELSMQIFALAVGVLVAGAAQAAYQYPALRREGFRFRWVSPWGNETVKTVVWKMVPGMMGVAAFQLNIVITQGLAWSVDPTIFASFDYAVRLMELPQGVCGISLATYLLPTLSALAAEKKFPEFRGTLRQAIGYLAFVNLLATVLLIALAEPIIRLLFEGGKFTAFSTHRAAFALACLAPGLTAFSMVHIFARAFYALGDTSTPMKISSFCLIVNILFTMVLLPSFAQGGLGLANSLSALLNVSLLAYALRRKLRRLDLGSLKQPFFGMVGGAVVAGAVAWYSWRFWESHWGHANLLLRGCAVFVPMALASGAYLVVLRFVKVEEAREFLELVRGRLRRVTGRS